MSGIENNYEAEQEKDRVENADVSIETRKLSQEAFEIAKRTLAEALETNDVELHNLPSLLREQVKTLPFYKTLEESLTNASPKTLPRELFTALHALKKSPEAVSGDGVLIPSMRKGSLHCAGKVMIGSTFLKERNIKHWVVSTIAGNGGHSVLLIEADDDTYAYCDAENGLYFTFPKEALSGDPSDIVSRQTLKEFTPRSKDTAIGLGSMHRTFVMTEPDMGIASQYMENLQGALAGNEEFSGSHITPSAQGAEAIDQMKREFQGNSSQQFSEATDNLYDVGIASLQEKNTECERLAVDAFNTTNGNKEEFCSHFSHFFENHPIVSSLFPYLQHASKEAKMNAAEKIWLLTKTNLSNQ